MKRSCFAAGTGAVVMSQTNIYRPSWVSGWGEREERKTFDVVNALRATVCCQRSCCEKPPVRFSTVDNINTHHEG